jgi:hypothetical protein
MHILYKRTFVEAVIVLSLIYMFDCSTCTYEACALAHVLPSTVMLLLEEVKTMPGYLTWN